MFISGFSNTDDIINKYGAPDDALAGATIHIAWYEYGSYDGSSLVIFEKDGTLYEVNGSHCSCYGLEGQWKPEETSWEALQMRRLEQYYDDGPTEASIELYALCDLHLGKKEVN